MECAEPTLVRWLATLYGGFVTARSGSEDRFRLGKRPRGGWWGDGPSGARTEWSDPVDGLAWLDDALTVGVQRRRPDLLFIHAAAIALRGRVALLAAESGGGKSTTTFAALHHGFALLGDEVAPIDPGGTVVHPYPRAICLKSAPPAPYRLPPGTLRGWGARYVATPQLPAVSSRALPLALIAFVSHSPQDERPTLRPVGAAEGAARLYAHSLNALAHGGEGLDAVLALSSRVPSFVLRSGHLPTTCGLLAEALGA